MWDAKGKLHLSVLCPWIKKKYLQVWEDYFLKLAPPAEVLLFFSMEVVDKAGSLLQKCSRLVNLVLVQVNGFQIQSCKFKEPPGFSCTVV